MFDLDRLFKLLDEAAEVGCELIETIPSENPKAFRRAHAIKLIQAGLAEMHCGRIRRI